MLCCVVTDSCRRDLRPPVAHQPPTRTATTTVHPATPRYDNSDDNDDIVSSPPWFHAPAVRPSTTSWSSGNPDDPDYRDPDQSREQQHIRYDDDDDDDDDLDFEASGRRPPPPRTRPNRGRPQTETGSSILTGRTSFTGSSILSDDGSRRRPPPKVFPAPPPVRTTSGGRGHQRHVVSVTSSSSASGSGAVRLPVVTSFLACALATLTVLFHRATASTVY